jgi:asparagine synthase (glutamine-hydrolysing)
VCGFVGFTGHSYNDEEKNLIINKMSQEILHRGPDGGGFFCDEEFAVGFRRLSIIDVSENGNQPMLNEDGSVVLVFNGEIYNFQELRKPLVAAGHIFKSQTDSEVLVHGYEEFKEGLLEKLRGMFALAIWDKTAQKLLIARDHFGIKPVYYCRTKDNNLLFGSEIKSLLLHPLFEKRLNQKALKPYMTFQYPVTQETFFKGVFKLRPGHFLTFKNEEVTTQAYFRHIFSAKPVQEKKLVGQLRDVISGSVKAHKISDVPVGAFVSSGVDSSYIAAEACPENVFSIGFKDENFDETVYAKDFARIINAKAHVKHLEPEECFENFGKIQYHLDEPSSNPSVVPLFFLAELAAGCGVKVVLSGEGADELFGGYDAYTVSKKMRYYRRFVPKIARCGIARFASRFVSRFPVLGLIRGGKTEWEDFIGHAYIFTEKESSDLLQSDYDFEFLASDLTGPYYEEMKGKDSLTQKIFLDFNLWLPNDILLKADKMSMAHSLELRTPFLDKEVGQLADAIPGKLKIKGGVSKYILRKAAANKLSAMWAQRAKKGFPVPIAFWLREKRYYERVKEMFVSRTASLFFRSDGILKLLNDHYRGERNNARKVWTVYTFLVWYDQYFVRR